MGIEVRTTDHDRTHLRELVHEGEAVSSVTVLDAPIRLLGAKIGMGGIGGVETEPGHRMRGHARRLLQDTVKYMTARGQEVSMLFGIPDFYGKLGFAACLPEHWTVIATRDAERAAEGPAGYRTRPATKDDLPFIVRLCNEDSRFRAAALVREEGHFSGFHRGSSYGTAAAAFVVENESGMRTAYAVYDVSKTEVKVTEANAADRRVFWGLLHEFARMAVERRCGHLELHMPADHPLVRFALRYGARTHVQYRRTGGGMMRVLNQDALFRKLKPALESRIKCSDFAGKPLTLHIETDLGGTEVSFNSAASADSTDAYALTLRQDVLMQLVVGYRAAADILVDDDVKAEGNVEPLLHVLFGGQMPYVWHADRF